MRISLFLNSTMSKSCVQPRAKDWFQQDRKLHTFSAHNIKTLFSYEANSNTPSTWFHSRSAHGSRIKQFPAFLNACYELQWFINSKTTLSQAFDAAVKQIYLLSPLLLLYLTLVLLLAQVAGLALIFSCAITLPIGFQFMLVSVVLISATAFKIMY